MHLLEICPFASRGVLDKLLPAVSIPKAGLTDAFKDIIFGFDSGYLDVAVCEAMKEFLTACER